MQSENNVQLNLDISEVKGHLNSIENRLEKIRYLKQYIPLLAEYALHEPFQVEIIVAEMPSEIQEEIWKIYSEELGFEGSKPDSNTSVEQKKEEVKFQEPKKYEPVRQKQKSNRTNQLHELIMKIALVMKEEHGRKPSSRKLRRKIDRDYLEYDEEAIIQEVTEKGIDWRSKYGIVQHLKWSSFDATFSRLWKKYLTLKK